MVSLSACVAENVGRVVDSCHDELESGMIGKIFGSGKAVAVESRSKLTSSSGDKGISCIKSKLSNQGADPGDRLPIEDVTV